MEQLLQDKRLISKCLHKTGQTTLLPTPGEASAEVRELVGSNRVFLLENGSPLESQALQKDSGEKAL